MAFLKLQASVYDNLPPTTAVTDYGVRLENGHLTDSFLMVLKLQ